mgnify:CR=1 FL=1
MAVAKKDRNRELYEAKEAGVPFTKLADTFSESMFCGKVKLRLKETDFRSFNK